MKPTAKAIERLREKLRLETPLIGVYDSAPDPSFGPMIEAKGRTCRFAFYQHWLKGKTLVLRKDGGGCGGGQIALGLKKEYPDYMAHFLSDGKGAPMGEGLKAGPEIVQEFLDKAESPDLSGDTVLIGPLRLDRWDSVRSVTFLVDPDRLAALMTLSAFWSPDTRLVSAPFSSGCGMLWRELEYEGIDRPVIGATDLAMRKYLPPEVMAFSVTPARFEQMLSFPDDSFLDKEWWNDLMDHRERTANRKGH
jgi:hypothetical protein